MTTVDSGFAMSTDEYAARVLHCEPSEWCTGTQGFRHAGKVIAADGSSFDRYRCVECGVNRPESQIGRTVLERDVPLSMGS